MIFLLLGFTVHMLKPISIENDNLLIHPFRPDDFERYEQLVQDIYSILSDDRTLKFIPSKRLHLIAHLLYENKCGFWHSSKSKSPANRAISRALYVLILNLVIPLGFEPRTTTLKV
jgi:hypothetical protein